VNRQEWAAIVDPMLTRWPHVDWKAYVKSGTIDDWYAVLADCRADQVAAACEVLYAEGREWPPNGAQIRERLILLSIDAPEWMTVKAALPGGHQVVGPQSDFCPDGRCDGSTWILGDDDLARPCTCREARIASGRPTNPLIAAFIDEVGTAELRDVAGDRTAEAQVRGKWEAFVARVQDAERLANIDPAGLPALERASANRLPRHLDTTAVLEAIQGGQAA
jgi:hypothetical protein